MFGEPAGDRVSERAADRVRERDRERGVIDRCGVLDLGRSETERRGDRVCERPRLRSRATVFDGESAGIIADG